MMQVFVTQFTVQDEMREYNRGMERYTGHIDRFAGTAKDYNWSNPLQAAAGLTHIGTSGLGADPAIRQGLGTLDGSVKDGVPAYSGIFNLYGKTTENTLGTLGNIFRLRLGAALGGLINIPGDFISDTADMFAGVRHDRPAQLQSSTKQEMEHAMAA